MNLPDLRSYYLSLAMVASAGELYRLVVEALGQRGDTLAALEVALAGAGGPVLLGLDDAQVAFDADWGAWLLESLARVARGQDLMLVAATEGAPPVLSERFAMLNLGAYATPEIRLLTDAYLDSTGVSFTADELRTLAELSAAHPAYLQRAAFHLFQSKRQPGYDWRATYLREASERPVPGAPLPPQVFEGEVSERVGESAYGEEGTQPSGGPPLFALPEIQPAFLYALPLLAGLLVYLVSRNLVLALVLVVAGFAAVLFLRHH
jgi:hypothetical protein